MSAILCRLLVLVTIVAFAAGMTVQVTPSAAALGLSSNSEVDTGCPRGESDVRTAVRLLANHSLI